jgi:hypothetical protein
MQHQLGCEKRFFQHFAHYKRTDSRAVELPEQPADPIEELGTALAGLCCKTCCFNTVNPSVMRIHLKRNHQQAWKGGKSELFQSVKVQTFFSSGGLQKYFRVDLGVREIRLLSGNSKITKKCERRLKTRCK